MSRPRTPTKILEAKGSFKKHPERRRIEPEVTGEIGEAPGYFDEDEKTAWCEIVANSHKDVLSSADRIIVEVISRLIAEARTTPISELKTSRLALIASGLGRLGFTPADRAKISVPVKKENKEWDDF